jgi:hypothetical protein
LVLTTLLLLCCNTISGEVPQTPAAPAAVETRNSELNSDRTTDIESAKPDAPTPKVAFASSSKSDADLESAGEVSAAPVQPALKAPVKPAITESYETSRKRKIWYTLMVLDHSTAAFDAWTTRRAISGGYGVEGDPLQKPFATSGAIYATTQVTPVVMDFLAHRMMRSEHPLMRKMWWVPQAASAGMSFGAGIHNYSMVP